MINHHEFTGRNRIAAFLSDDDGETWPYSLLLDERPSVSYPDVAECPDGSILCIYDRERVSMGEILMARFTEEDICAGEMVTESSYRKRKISAYRKCELSLEDENED